MTRSTRFSLAAVLVSLVTAAATHAQLVPDRLYYGIDRPIPMTITVPEDTDGQPSIHLLSADDANILAESPVESDEDKQADEKTISVDLAEMFPTIWEPEGGRVERAYYAQLVVDEEKVGPAVVIQSLITPWYTAAVNNQHQPVNVLDQNGYPNYQDLGRVYSGIRTYVDKEVVLETTEGDIRLRLRPDAAPNTCWNFRTLVEGGFYTDIAFHRVVSGPELKDRFVIQAGDPTGTGAGGPGYFVDIEPSTLLHDFGVLSMARSTDPNTNGSQFFLCLTKERTAILDNRYTAFGQTLEGGEVINAIGSVKTGPNDRPEEPMPKVERAYLVDAPPHGEGDKVQQNPLNMPAER